MLKICVSKSMINITKINIDMLDTDQILQHWHWCQLSKQLQSKPCFFNKYQERSNQVMREIIITTVNLFKTN